MVQTLTLSIAGGHKMTGKEMADLVREIAADMERDLEEADDCEALSVPYGHSIVNWKTE